MDPQRFDELATSLACGLTRRRLLALLFGGGVATLAGCDGTNGPGTEVAPTAACLGAGETDCGERCVDLRSDAFNCGACGVACQSGVCQGGVCLPPQVLPTPPCAGEGLAFCQGVCVDPRSDPLNCGACGQGCGSGVCQDGICLSPQTPTPSPESATCPSDAPTDCGGVCVDLQRDALHCGACGVTCGDDFCYRGVCSQYQLGCLGEGLTQCGLDCVDLQRDALHCGTCGQSCPSNVCLNGVCLVPAPTPEMGALVCPSDTPTDCGGVCVDTETDRAHCGGCESICRSGVCNGGICLPPLVCGGFLTDCGGRCVDLQTDPENCGECFAVCASGTCRDGACRPSLPLPTAPVDEGGGEFSR